MIDDADLWAHVAVVRLDPAGFLMDRPTPVIAGFCLMALGLDGLDDEEASRALIAGVVKSSKHMEDHDRETVVARAQRAVGVASDFISASDPTAGSLP